MNSKSARAPHIKRSYHSTVRETRKEETRQHILNALVAKMVKGNFSPVSMEEIAKAAGIGPATLYWHFPNREALWDGLSNEFNRRVGSTSYPRTPTEITDSIKRDFAIFDEHPGLVQAYFLTEAGRKARSHGRARRLKAIQDALAETTSRLAKPKRSRVIAVIAYLASLQSWMTMTSEFGLTGAEVGEAVTWAIQTLLNAVEEEEKNAKG